MFRNGHWYFSTSFSQNVIIASFQAKETRKNSALSWKDFWVESIARFVKVNSSKYYGQLVTDTFFHIFISLLKKFKRLGPYQVCMPYLCTIMYNVHPSHSSTHPSLKPNTYWMLNEYTSFYNVMAVQTVGFDWMNKFAITTQPFSILTQWIYLSKLASK